MSLFWTQPERVLSRTWKLSLAVRQNHHLLFIAGEPVYLLRRVRAEDRQPINGSGPTVMQDPETGLYLFNIWQDPSDSPFPDDRSIAVSVNGETWEQAFDKYSLVSGEKEFAVEIFRDAITPEGNPIGDKVVVWLSTPPFVPVDTVAYTYKEIQKTVDTRTMQPGRVDCPAGGEAGPGADSKSLYGLEQYKNPRSYWRGNLLPNTFPLAFPDVMRDKVDLTNAGFIRVSEMKHWTSPPPLCPTIREHDYIIRRTNGRRYEVTSQTEIRIGAKLVQQQFDVTEVDAASSVMNYPVETN